MRRWGLAAAVMAASVFVATPVWAQDAGAGVRAGYSADPDQFFFGGHVQTRPLVERLTFRPNIEVGVGNDVTLVALNLEFAYWTRVAPDRWRMYLGGGPSAVIVDHDRNDDSDAGGGFNLMLGVQHPQGLFGEVKVGLGDSPDLKLTVGYVFR